MRKFNTTIPADGKRKKAIATFEYKESHTTAEACKRWNLSDIGGAVVIDRAMIVARVQPLFRSEGEASAELWAQAEAGTTRAMPKYERQSRKRYEDAGLSPEMIDSLVAQEREQRNA